MAIPSYFKRLIQEYVTGSGSSDVAQQAPVQSVNSETGDVTVPTGSTPAAVVQTYDDLPLQNVNERELYYVDNATNGDFVYPTQLSPDLVRWVSLLDGTVVASATPDSVDDRWKLSDGSGATVANSIGSIDMTLSSTGMWVSNSKYTGGYAVENTNEEDFTVSNINLNRSKASICFWTDSISSINGSFGRLISVSPQAPNLPTNGYEVYFGGSGSTSLIGRAYSGGGSSKPFDSSLSVDLSTDDYFICVRVNGDTLGVRIYDGTGTKTDDISGTGTRGQTADANLVGMSVDHESDAGGIFDDVFASRGEILPESEEKALANETAR